MSSQASSSSRSTRRTPTKKPFKRSHTRPNESFKDCNWCTYGARDHISTNCPKNERYGINASNLLQILKKRFIIKTWLMYTSSKILPTNESIYEQKEFSSQKYSDRETESESDWRSVSVNDNEKKP